MISGTTLLLATALLASAQECPKWGPGETPIAEEVIFTLLPAYRQGSRLHPEDLQHLAHACATGRMGSLSSPCKAEVPQLRLKAARGGSAQAMLDEASASCPGGLAQSCVINAQYAWLWANAAWTSGLYEDGDPDVRSAAGQWLSQFGSTREGVLISLKLRDEGEAIARKLQDRSETRYRIRQKCPAR